LVLSSSDDEKILWKNIEEQLNEIKVEDLGYDHLLCSGILDI
ncbi:16823_t:CDS:1, partial [Entrophospora sp. SA101]